MVQWLRLCLSTAEDVDLIPGQGTKILQPAWHGQKKKILRLLKGFKERVNFPD